MSTDATPNLQKELCVLKECFFQCRYFVTLSKRNPRETMIGWEIAATLASLLVTLRIPHG